MGGPGPPVSEDAQPLQAVWSAREVAGLPRRVRRACKHRTWDAAVRPS